MVTDPPLNVLFVSHCALDQNSGLQIAGLGAALRDHGVTGFAILPDLSVVDRRGGAPSCLPHLQFPNGRHPDLIHAWTPRERVRRQVMELRGVHAVPYIVHLEDNERQLLDDRQAGQPIGGPDGAAQGQDEPIDFNCPSFD